jgi:acetolactate synthase-1/2/3 large subunit
VVFIVGSDAGAAIGSVLSLIMHLKADVVVTPQGKGLVSPYHPQFRGVFGFTGHSSARETLLDSKVNLVVAVGVLFGEASSGAWDTESLLNSRLVHVEETTGHLTRTPMARLHVRGSLQTIFEQINQSFGIDTEHYQRSHRTGQETAVEERKRHFKIDNHQAYISNSKPIKPQRLMHDLPKLFPSHTRYLMDVGNSFAWGTHYLHPFDRRMAGSRQLHSRLFSACFDFASMGWAIGSAVGTALAVPDTPVVCITGDGSWLMSAQELTVAIEERLCVIFIIINDSAYGMVRHGQLLTGAELTAHSLAPVNFCAMAESMGAYGSIINTPKQLNQLDIDAICSRNGPTLLDVRIDPDEVPPIGMRTNVLSEK